MPVTPHACRIAPLLAAALCLGAEAIPTELPEFQLEGPVLLASHLRAQGLVVADVDGDGREDIIVISNDEGALLVHHQQRDPEASVPFTLSRISLDRNLRSLVAIDVNGDGRLDLVGATRPPGLSIFHQNNAGRLEAPTRIDIEAEHLATGDVTGNGRPDLVTASGKRVTLVLGTQRGLDFENPVMIPAMSTPSAAPLILDLNGDGLADLAWQPTERRDGIAVRLQTADGAFPDEVFLPIEALRSLDRLRTTRGGDLIAGIPASTSQLVLYALSEPDPEDAENAWHGFAFENEASEQNPSAVIADSDGDGLPDVVVALPRAARLRVLRTLRGGQAELVDSPTFMDVRQVVALPEESGSGASLLVVSGEESALGIAHPSDDTPGAYRLPRPIHLGSTPLAVGIANGGNGTQLIAVHPATEDTVETRARRTTVDDIRLASYNLDAVIAGEPQDDWSITPLAEARGVRSGVTGMDVGDWNGDGHPDAAVFFSTRGPMLFLGNEDGTMRAVEPVAMLRGMLDQIRREHFVNLGDSFLLIRPELARVIALDAEGRPEIRAQLNAPDPRAQYRAAWRGSFTARDTDELAVFDGGNRKIYIYPAEGATAPLAEIEAEDGNHLLLLALDFDRDGVDDLTMLASDRMAVRYFRPRIGRLKPVANARTEVEEGGYGLVSETRLRGASAPIVGVVEVRENGLEFWRMERVDGTAGIELRRAYRFRVFDSDNPQRRPGAGGQPEPREIVVRDITENDLPDIVTLVHDKIILYYQKPREGRR